MNRELLVQIKNRVELGAEKLAIQFRWWWFLKIDVAKLDMTNAQYDILGQLYEGYLTGLDRLGIPKQEAYLFGFNVDISSPDREEALRLTQAWREKILGLRAKTEAKKRARVAQQKLLRQKKKAEAVQWKPLRPQPRRTQPSVHLL